MKKFLKNILSFLILLILIIFFSDITLSYFQNRFSSFKLIENPKYIILGHSQSAMAYNDTIISDLRNLSDLGESYFYTFIKLKKILEHNKTIETIFLEYSSNQVIDTMDEWIWGFKKMNYRYPKYSSYMNFYENLVLIRNNPIDFLFAYSSSLRYKLEFFLFNDLNVSNSIGGFRMNKTTSKNEEIINERVIKYESLPVKSSKKNIEYLIKIINYCKELNVNVVLISSPTLSHNNNKIYLRLLENELSEVAYFNFSEFPLNHIYFEDNIHLNFEGANLISIWFENLLKKDFVNYPEQRKILQEKIKSWKKK